MSLTEKTPTLKPIPNPINIYGKSKLEGEKAVQEIFDNFLILRVSWVLDKILKRAS